MRVFTVLISTLALIFSACGPANFDVTTRITSGVVYGEDSRQEPGEHTSAVVKKATQASGAIIRNSHIKKENSKFWSILAKPIAKQRNLCPDVRFAKQMTASYCSGVLIGPDRFLTAGHCVESGCDEFQVVFGWTHAKGLKMPAKDVYSCRSIVKLHFSDDVEAPDMAIVQLDRRVKGRAPVEISFEPLREQEDLLLVGYPSGLPQKVSTAKVRKAAGEANYANITSDTFTGDSGGPVFSLEGKVKGILIGGEEDYVYAEKRGCYIVNTCKEDECRGEDVLQMRPSLLD